MDMARVWPIILEYGCGALLCSGAIFFGLRSGFLDLKTREGKRLLGIIIGGFLAMLALVCAFTFWLPYVPKGVAP